MRVLFGHRNEATRRRRRYTAIDLFCGCGGMTEGLKRAGFRIIAGVEIDPLASKTYRRNHPRVKLWLGDIRKIPVSELLRTHGLRPGELDLLAGCPPCQAFSSMRRLNGARRIRDKRSKDLVFEYLRFVRKLRPKVILIENVPRLKDDRRFSEVRRSLGVMGYAGEPTILNAADFGVAQRRRRMVLIASRVGAVGYPEANSADSPRTVRGVIGRLMHPGKARDPLHKLSEKRTGRIARLIRSIPKDGGSRDALGRALRLKCHERCNGFKDVYGRMAWDDVAPTITGGCVNPSKGRFLHPTQNRAITLREAALLQSFPPDYFFSLEHGKFAAAEMIGNAFPPRFAELQARRIREHLACMNGRREPRGNGRA